MNRLGEREGRQGSFRHSEFYDDCKMTIRFMQSKAVGFINQDLKKENFTGEKFSSSEYIEIV